MVRSLVKVLAVFGCAFGLSAGSAAAQTTVYVASTGSGNACTQGAPCSFDTGVKDAAADDIVSVAAGLYASAGDLNPANGVDIEGPAGGTATVNFTNTNSGGISLANPMNPLLASANQMSSLTLTCASCGTLVASTGADTLDRLHLIDSTSNEPALLIAAGAPDTTFTVTNSVMAGAGDGVEVGPIGSGGTAMLTNDTLIGSSGDYGLLVMGGADVDLENSIAYVAAHPGATSVYLESNGGGNITFSSVNSNYPAPTVNTGGGGTVTDTSQTNEQTTPPMFVADTSGVADADYEEAAGSDTIGAGDASLVSGSLDLAGEPRTLGGALDIGAYQYVPPPTISVSPASGLTSTGATLNGTVATAGATGTAAFNYGPTTAYGNSSAATSLTSTSSAQTATAALTGLTPGTTYHYELCVTLVFSDCSADQTVTTPPNLPAISGEQVSGISASGAALAATVNPGNGATQVSFQYGTSTGYGATTPAQSLAPALTAQPVSATLSALKPETIYHARAVATNSAGTTDGPDVTFVTSAAGGAPGLGAVKLVPSSFTAASGSELEVTLSQASRVTVQITQTLTGHKQHGRCSTSAKHGKRCPIVRKRGSRSFVGAIGSDTFRFKATGLAAGTYVAKVVATNLAGQTSPAVMLKFTIKPTKKKKKKK